MHFLSNSISRFCRRVFGEGPLQFLQERSAGAMSKRPHCWMGATPGAGEVDERLSKQKLSSISLGTATSLFTQICTCTHMCTHMWVCIQRESCINVDIYTYISTYTHTYVHALNVVHTHIYIYVYVHVLELLASGI